MEEEVTEPPNKKPRFDEGENEPDFFTSLPLLVLSLLFEFLLGILLPLPRFLVSKFHILSDGHLQNHPNRKIARNISSV